MKYISTLFVAIAFMAVGTVNAQTASKLNGQSYTYVMKDINGMGPEIIDVINFGVGTVNSKNMASAGFTAGKVMEKNAGASSSFEITFKSETQGTKVFTGKAEGATIEGTIIVTDKDGVQSTMAFRGMLSEEWDNVRKEKENYQQQLQKEKEQQK